MIMKRMYKTPSGLLGTYWPWLMTLKWFWLKTLDLRPWDLKTKTRTSLTQLYCCMTWSSKAKKTKTSSSIQCYGMPSGMQNWHWWDTYKCICKELLITDGGLKTDTNIGSNGDGSSLEVPRTSDLLGEQTSALFIGQWSQLIEKITNSKRLYLTWL